MSGISAKRNPRLLLETLEGRLVPANAAFDLIGLTALRANPETAGFTGSGIAVAVIDTGVDYTHTLLNGAIVRDKNGNLIGRDFINDTEEGSEPGEFVFSSLDNNPEDVVGHGTHVAGIIAARNPDIGVAQNAGLIGIKVLDDQGSGSSDDILSGLRWVSQNADKYNIRVVNMSLGFGFFNTLDPNDPFRLSIQQLEEQGITVVSAAGNSYAFTEGNRDSASPGIGSTLNVGATWKDGVNSFVHFGNSIDFTTGARRITSFSQRPPAAGPNTLDNEIFAPGALITSTIPNNGLDPSSPNNLLADLAGTSMASPMVAGMVAIMQDAALQLGGRYLNPAEVRQILTSTAQSINDGDDEDDTVINTGANYRFARIDLAVNQIRSLFNTPNVADDPNGTIGSALSLNYDFRSSIVLDGNLGNDGGFGSAELSLNVNPFTASGNIPVGRKDVDFYRIQFDQPGTLTVNTSDIVSGANPTINTAVRVFNATGAQIAVNDDIDPFTGTGDTSYTVQSKVSLSVSAGVYFIAISGGQNIAYNPNTELSGIDAVDRPTGAPALSGNGIAPSAQGNYRFRVTFEVVDPNGTLAGAEESPVQVGGNLIRRGFLGGDYLTANVEFPRPDQLIVNTDPTLRFGTVVDSNALETVGGVTRFRRNSAGLPDTSDVRDVDMYITTAPADGFIALDVDSKFYQNIDLGDGSTGSVAADTRIRAWKVNSDNTLTPLADSFDGAFSDDDGRDPSDPNDESQSATFDSFFQVRVNAGDRVVFGVSNWLLNEYDPTTTDNRELSGGTLNRSVGFYDAFLSFRTDDDLNGRIGADIYNFDTRNSTTTSSKEAPIARLPVVSTSYSIGKDIYSDLTPQESFIGPKDVDFYWFTTASAGVLFVDIDSVDIGLTPSVETILSAYEITTSSDGTRTLALVGFSDSTIDPITGEFSLDPSLGINVLPGRDYYIGVSGYNNFSFDPFRYASGVDSFQQGDYRLESNFVPNADVTPEPVITIPDENERGQFEFFSGNMGSDSAPGQTNRRTTGVDIDTYEYTATKSGTVVFRVNPESEFGSTPSFRVFSKASGATNFTPVTGLQTDGTEAINVVAGTKYSVVISGGRGAISVDSSGKFSSASTRGSTGGYTLSLDESGTQLSVSTPVAPTFRSGVTTRLTGFAVANSADTPSGTPLTYTVTASVPSGSGTLFSGTTSGTSSVKFTGTLAQVNAKLAALDFKSAVNRTTAVPVTVVATASNGASSTKSADVGIRTGTAFAAADPELAGKTSLFVQGTTGADTITVARLTASSYRVTMNGTPVTVSGITGRILGYLLAGNDSYDSKTTTIGNRIFGGDGDDIIQTGSAADAIFGEAGNDGLAGGLGADVIMGGAGKDILVDGSIAQKGARTLRQSLDAYVALPPSATAAQYNSLASFITFTRDSASRDTLNGEADLDLFFAALATDIAGRAAGENFRSA